MLVQAVEVARCVEEGILRNSRDAEVGAIFGIGFAPSSGGPLAWMDRRGIANIVKSLEALMAEDPAFGARWKPPALLVGMAERGERFWPKA
jgi:3-hydroxyacyl-CoA dehydrogenase/enoyl-CoA hydratase/3-hydroxybutyryl-CoA epimerase